LNHPKSRSRLFFARPLTLIAVLLAVILVGGLLVIRTMRYWRNDIIDRNLSLTTMATRHLAAEAEKQWRDWPLRNDEQGILVVAVHPDTLRQQLSRLAARVFVTAPGLKGGFWVLQENEFIGYADPWSPAPAPAFGPPPRSYPIILQQVQNTIRDGEPIARLHQFDSVSVGKTVFTLATSPVRRDGRIVAVAWARIHLERDLPASKLSRYLDIAAFVTMAAFLAALLTTMIQRREIRSLNENLLLIEQDPSCRLAHRRGMFGSIRFAINRMLGSLEAANRHQRSLEEQLHQQDKMASLGNLLAGVAHEIKTPLAIVKTRVQIWQRDLEQFSRDTGHQQPLTEESMQMVLKEIDRLSSLLRKLLYFSRPVRQDLMQPLDIDDLIRHTVLFAKPRIVQRRIDLDLNLAARGAEIVGEADSLHQAFLNILTNSLDLVNEGGLVSIASRIDRDGGRVVLDFLDNGPGLAPEIRKQAFTPFFTTRHGGSGLGLSITHEIVSAHQGMIEFREPDGHLGAHCRVTFPLHRTVAEEK
jgi:signal transduction histidine kinase